MKTTIASVVSTLKQRTGIDIDIYDALSGLIASTGGMKKYAYVPKSHTSFKDGIYLDEVNELTYFLINSGRSNLVGVLEHTDDTSKNYAFMAASMIENAILRQDHAMTRVDMFKSILLGDVTREQIQRFITKFSIPTLPCYVLVVNSAREKQGEVLNLLTQFSDADDATVVMDDVTTCYIKFYSVENEYQSPLNFAETLYGSLIEEINVYTTIGVGTSIKSVHEIAVSYEEAMAAIRMGNLVSAKPGAYSYKEYIMLKMIEDIPKNKLKLYFDMLIDSSVKEILSDNDMVATAEEFLNDSLNISETSRNLYMHRNTLLYRLDKIEKAMGLNIRKFSDAVTFRIITILYKLLKK